jgi:AcrR family transcriptional regulator
MSKRADRSTGPELRERRRQRMSLEIERAALELFAERGYASVTVEDIAAAADISERTFFRYFANKDDVLIVEERRRMDALRELLESQDPREPAWRALHNAILELSARLEADGRSSLWARITDQAPELQAKLMAHAATINDTVITELVAQRLHTDRATDLRPAIITRSMIAASHIAYRRWLDGSTGRSLTSLTEEALSVVERGLIAEEIANRTVV